MEPPIVRFMDLVRHPNIDEVSGRICLERMPPEGSWKRNVSLGSVLISIQVLLGSPNLEDPVLPDLISEWQLGFKENSIDMIVKTENGSHNSKRSAKPECLSFSLAALRKKPKFHKDAQAE